MNKKTYNIFVIGCQMNISDSERIAFSLESLAYTFNDDIYNVDLAIITTCGVKQSAENRIYGLVPAIKKKNPKVKIIITGCMSGERILKKRLGEYVDIWMPIIDLDKLPIILGENIKKEIRPERDYLELKAKYESEYSAFVPIGNGCNNFCSYCYVPYARGREKYRNHRDILQEVLGLLEKGFKEITLIAQNVNSYKSEDVNFSKLLKMVNDLEGNFWLRFSTSHPKDMSDELIEVMGECDKLCHHIHLPAQAGDDEVLKNMNRKYSKKHYLGLIEKIRKTLNAKVGKEINGFWNPAVSITTDIIVGFPGETKKQFNETLNLFKSVKYDMAYISPYSPRPNTAAAEMEDVVPQEEKRRRENELNNVLSKYCLENNQLYLNKSIEVLVDGKTKKGEWLGKTKTSKTVIIRIIDKNISLGDILKIKIYKVKNFGIYGEFI